MKLLKEDEDILDERRSKKVDYYNDLVNAMGPGYSKNFDKWAKTRTCRVFNCSEDDLEEDLTNSVLTEDTTLGDAAKAASELDAQVSDADNKGQIESVLDRALSRNKAQQKHGKHDFQNILLIGEAGSGKSSIVRKWAKDNNINLYEVRAAGMDDTDLGGAISPSKDYSTVVRLASTEFDALNRPNSVLFLDEYNRAPKSVRTNLLELVNSHVVPDPREPSGQRYLENFLFTIAAINPASSIYDTDKLDMAERTRFKSVDVVMSPQTLLRHLTAEFTKDLETEDDPEEIKMIKGRLALSKAILTNKNFAFDSAADTLKADENGENSLNYRSFKELMLDCDGTKEDFLDLLPSYLRKDTWSMFREILHNYQDVDDKANDALKTGTTSKIFNSEKSNMEKIYSKFGNQFK